MKSIKKTIYYVMEFEYFYTAELGSYGYGFWRRDGEEASGRYGRAEEIRDIIWL